MGTRVTVIPLILVYGCVLVLAFPCTYNFPQPTKATFDLSALTLASGSYFAKDSDVRDPFFYQFNVCENLSQLPPSKPATVCADPSNQMFPAYQIVNSSIRIPNGACFAIGSLNQPSWAFINENDESIGVELTYNGGSSQGCATPRSLKISFRCAHSGVTSLQPISSVYEDTECIYYLDFYSIHACPQECKPVAGVGGASDSLCGGQGLCSVDEDIGGARCFCYQGHAGSDCSQTVAMSSSTSPTTVLIAITFTLIALLACMATVLFIKIRKLNTDDSNYGQLKDENSSTSKDENKDSTLPSTVPS